ncbi:MAG: DUF1178 family protein [Devosia sp.]|uniref:DUF1178 family protein n=1 Tax=Devosia sp. XGJD_8 TaxID=3391187 RepID=UPI001DE37883|nr:DUF1178 family protein [Alphaproteobacteria bacterium]MBU1561169.1 DUF1178 family protein [Alphaproteobacteria bacterium]MBU2302446.1 DUF1178 family protein [Alphaproteobacteria bacterium]MBU2366594.1 DUF1178 family protein [Alphaproteobacteria bacterium]
MIQYSLHCSKGHRYDAWFKNAAAFDEQQARGIVTCAVCGDAAIEKAPMAPAVARTDHDRVALSSTQPDAAQLRALLRAYRQKVVSEADYVGDRFAEEARKIHFEEVEARGIYGEATRDDVVALLDEGIDFMPLPDLPEEHN